MIELIKAMERLQAEESKRANAIHGDAFKSFAEGWLALEEEVDEAMDELKKMIDLKASFLRGVRYQRGPCLQKLEADNLRYAAILAACELVQVAHVAHKMIESPEVWES